eukprot:7075628-Prymnesium_polylepis.1
MESPSNANHLTSLPSRGSTPERCPSPAGPRAGARAPCACSASAASAAGSTATTSAASAAARSASRASCSRPPCCSSGVPRGLACRSCRACRA